MKIEKIIIIVVVAIISIFIAYQAYHIKFISWQLIIILLIVGVIAFIGISSTTQISIFKSGKEENISCVEARKQIMEFLKRDIENPMELDYSDRSHFQEKPRKYEEYGKTVKYYGILTRLKAYGDQYKGDYIQIYWNRTDNEFAGMITVLEEDINKEDYDIFANFNPVSIAGNYARRDKYDRYGNGNIIFGGRDPFPQSLDKEEKPEDDL